MQVLSTRNNRTIWGGTKLGVASLRSFCTTEGIIEYFTYKAEPRINGI